MISTFLLFILTCILILIAIFDYYTRTHLYTRAPKLQPASSKQLKYFPLVSVILPVRNEARNIRACLNSLINQTYENYEIIVIDGNSTDNTRDIVLDIKNKSKTSIELFSEGVLPFGWIGKSYANHIGANHASGEWFLFTDADTVHSENSLLSAMHYVLKHEVDFLSFITDLVMKSFWEKSVLSVTRHMSPVGFGLGWKRINDDRSKVSAAFGHYILIKGGVYKKIGGHEAIRDKIADDYSLAGITKGEKYKVRFLIGTDFVKVRLYTNLKEIWDGFSKNFFAVFNYGLLKPLVLILIYFIFFIIPFMVLPLGMLLLMIEVNSYSKLVFINGAIQVSILMMGQALFNKFIKLKLVYAVTFPLSAIIILGIMLNSILRKFLNKGYAWKDRIYNL
jgi:chlorobactene glucosyltransferase